MRRERTRAWRRHPLLYEEGICRVPAETFEAGGAVRRVAVALAAATLCLESLRGRGEREARTRPKNRESRAAGPP